MNTNSEGPALLPVPVATDRDPSRCHHRFPNGKRCRLPGPDSQLGLCLRHFTLSAAADLSRQHAHDDAEDFSAELLGRPAELASTIEVKQFLSRLLLLVTSGRISPRRAAVLDYITNSFAFHTPALAADGTWSRFGISFSPYFIASLFSILAAGGSRGIR